MPALSSEWRDFWDEKVGKTWKEESENKVVLSSLQAHVSEGPTKQTPQKRSQKTSAQEDPVNLLGIK